MPFLEAALSFYDSQGIQVRRILTDNGTGYLRRYREHAHSLGVRHSHTQPYHPWTNGRVERFRSHAHRFHRAVALAHSGDPTEDEVELRSLEHADNPFPDAALADFES